MRCEKEEAEEDIELAAEKTSFICAFLAVSGRF